MPKELEDDYLPPPGRHFFNDIDRERGETIETSYGLSCTFWWGKKRLDFEVDANWGYPFTCWCRKYGYNEPLACFLEDHTITMALAEHHLTLDGRYIERYWCQLNGWPYPLPMREDFRPLERPRVDGPKDRRSIWRRFVDFLSNQD